MMQKIAIKTARILRPQIVDLIREAFEEALKDRPSVEVRAEKEPEMLSVKDLQRLFKVSYSTVNIGVANGRFPPPVAGGGKVGGQRRRWVAQDVYDTVRLGSWSKVIELRKEAEEC